TQTLCELEAAVVGSWFAKVTSERPVIRVRLGTEAVIVTVPVEVAPVEPCVAAEAVLLAESEAAATPSATRRLPVRPLLKWIIISWSPGILDRKSTRLNSSHVE